MPQSIFVDNLRTVNRVPTPNELNALFGNFHFGRDVGIASTLYDVDKKLWFHVEVAFLPLSQKESAMEVSNYPKALEQLIEIVLLEQQAKGYPKRCKKMVYSRKVRALALVRGESAYAHV